MAANTLRMEGLTEHTVSLRILIKRGFCICDKYVECKRGKNA